MKSEIANSIVTAMKAGEKERLVVLRSLMSEIKNLEINSRKEATESDMIAIVSRAIKTRTESAEAYLSAGREDLYDVEMSEIQILKEFQPTQLTEEELSFLIDAVILEKSSNELKVIMPAVQQLTKGRADGGLVSKMVKTKLGL